ncbi:murein L,D-transpeptidase [Pseudovibrio sp. W64]|uniref:L,D-transpeptidase family protein n=1 Tax=unclassified Pseudovibrio TaxID=2627060 RepID=UPI000710C297|nr:MULTISPECIES: L,D-transpeptidase family protein [unclassified Pseudovibrio]KZK76432.1 murein L,D-transpeptidase [Pseudovibrio sp. W64]KZK99478.1 murein L,D-transpeptidase [Pseudovibrio sp. Ad5]KZL02914.1 murein L,D-transpeptidase [Pseudovibrio sp. W74]KZL07617.1 murein L,D-transpeptidase [Pseudovibrio sp. Ad14]KZL18196.1 murein L,D-transpeptidase [Pseudovibrio sp. Ad37]
MLAPLLNRSKFALALVVSTGLSAGMMSAQAQVKVPDLLSYNGSIQQAVSQPAPVAPTQPIVGQGTEWEDTFDEGVSSLEQIDFVAPIISKQTSQYMIDAILDYERIALNGGWPEVSTKKVLRIGMRAPAIAALRQRLIVSGDMAQHAGVSEVFDSYVDSAVRRFQLRHGLTPDGVVGRATVIAMNVPVEVRLQQLRTNLERVSALAENVTDTYVNVNIPAARIEVVENGRVRSRHTAVVGKQDRQSPILSSAIYEVNFNPYWTVPVSIIRKDLIPKMQKDPQYLAKNNIHIYDWYGKEKQWQEIDWNTDEATQYRFTQDPGEGNSMGSIRINFNNTHQVYLHDTPEQSLFGEGYRFHSSGCVRVQNVRELVTWLLGSTTPDWTRSRVDAAINSGERTDVKMKSRIPLHMSYVTAWALSDGMVHFRDDIYDKDGLYAASADPMAQASAQ